MRRERVRRAVIFLFFASYLPFHVVIVRRAFAVVDYGVDGDFAVFAYRAGARAGHELKRFDFRSDVYRTFGGSALQVGCGKSYRAFLFRRHRFVVRNRQHFVVRGREFEHEVPHVAALEREIVRRISLAFADVQRFFDFFEAETRVAVDRTRYTETARRA